MDHTLLIASVGHRMMMGASLGKALFEAATNHDAELKEWSDAQLGRYDKSGRWEIEPMTMDEFFKTRILTKGAE